MTKARTLADNFAADINGITAGTGITGGGTSGTVTITNDMATTIAAKGDLVAGTANDAYAALTVGANDTVLTADSSTATGLKWATPSSGGMTLLASGSLSGASVNLTSISSAYRDLVLIVRNYKTNSDDTAFNYRLNNDSGTRYLFTNYNSANFSNTNFGEDRLSIVSTNDNSVSQSFVYTVFYDYANTATWKLIDSLSITNNSTTTTNANMSKMFGAYNQTGAISQINMFGGDDFGGGTYELYGVK